MDHILSDLSTMTHPSWVAPQAWLCFIELDKAVVCVIIMNIFCYIFYYGFSVRPLMPSRNTYRLIWVYLILDVRYLITAAPAKHSRCSLPWMRGISSLLSLLTLNME